MVFVRNSIIAKRTESLEGEESDTIYMEVTLSLKESGVFLLLTDHHKMTTK